MSREGFRPAAHVTVTAALCVPLSIRHFWSCFPLPVQTLKPYVRGSKERTVARSGAPCTGPRPPRPPPCTDPKILGERVPGGALQREAARPAQELGLLGLRHVQLPRLHDRRVDQAAHRHAVDAQRHLGGAGGLVSFAPCTTTASLDIMPLLPSGRPMHQEHS